MAPQHHKVLICKSCLKTINITWRYHDPTLQAKDKGYHLETTPCTSGQRHWIYLDISPFPQGKNAQYHFKRYHPIPWSKDTQNNLVISPLVSGLRHHLETSPAPWATDTGHHLETLLQAEGTKHHLALSPYTYDRRHSTSFRDIPLYLGQRHWALFGDTKHR